MAFELQMLALVTLSLMLTWLPASGKCQTYGLGWLLSNRSTAALAPMAESGRRAERAHVSLPADYPGFAVAVLLAAASGSSTPGTRVAPAVPVGARVAPYPGCGLALCHQLGAGAWSELLPFGCGHSQTGENLDISGLSA